MITRTLRKCFVGYFVGIILTGISFQPAFATTYDMPSTGDMIGDLQYVSVPAGANLAAIARQYDIGFNQIAQANQSLDPNTLISRGTQLRIPSRFLLPPLAHKGIVINLPEMRMYYYLDNGEVKTYPIGIGRIGKTIPLIQTKIVRKVKDPVWIPPPDIRAYNEEQGIILPRIMPPGPENPLGPYAIYLKLPTYLIHSTIFPESVGRRASFGCIRMHETDIEDFFPQVTPGTSVTIINTPTKLGWNNGALYIEAHPPLEERSTEANATHDTMIETIQRATRGQVVLVDWQLVHDLAQTRDGIPHEIGFRIK